jgi:hypothetical protein
MQAKEKKILNTLKRYSEFYDQKQGVSLINDFLQLGHILEALQQLEDKKAFNAMYALIEQNLNDRIVVAERGKRIGKLQKGQTQPKGTGHKSVNGLKKEVEAKAQHAKKDKT